MAKEKDDHPTGKGQLGKPKNLTGTQRDPLPDLLNEEELDQKQDRLRIRRRQGPGLEEEGEERGLFGDDLPGADEPATDTED